MELQILKDLEYSIKKSILEELRMLFYYVGFGGLPLQNLEDMIPNHLHRRDVEFLLRRVDIA